MKTEEITRQIGHGVRTTGRRIASLITGAAVLAMSAMSIGIVSGCATVSTGRQVEFETLDRLVERSATTTEMLNELGPPQIRTSIDAATELWTYSFSTATAHVTPATVLIPFYSEVKSDYKLEMKTVVFKNGRAVRWVVGGADVAKSELLESEKQDTKTIEIIR